MGSELERRSAAHCFIAPPTNLGGCHCRHTTTRLGATAAGFGATLHQLAHRAFVHTSHALTLRRARFADIRADGTGLKMKRRIAAHKTGIRQANVGAVAA